MHRRFHIVAVLFLNLGSLPLLASALLAGHSLQLIVGKTQKLLGATSSKEHSPICDDFLPERISNHTLGKQKM
jgi:hypothetical protein